MMIRRWLPRAMQHCIALGLVVGISLPARANPLTDFAGQIADQAVTNIELALGQAPSHSLASDTLPDSTPRMQPGLVAQTPEPRTSRPASLMVSQAGMAALENMRIGASLDIGAARQEPASPVPLTPVMAGMNDNQVREAIVRDHLIAYVAKGVCMCPNQPDKAGQPCGHPAGYGHSNSNVAVCYVSQIDQRMVWEWRTGHPSGRS